MHTISGVDAAEVREQLEARGFALLPQTVSREEAVALRNLYDDETLFRSRVVMERHTFGRGEYQYFANPLPERVRALREGLYATLRPIANDWMRALGRNRVFPETHQEFLHDCFEEHQQRPTALLLRYRAGDYNRLHQDLCGPVAFPLQTTIYLSRPGDEFGGGEVVLTEGKPRAQTRAHVVVPQQGDLLILPASEAPIRGANGIHRAIFRHGVSTVTWGERYSLGIIFHDAL